MTDMLLAFLLGCCASPGEASPPSPWERVPLPEAAAGKTMRGIAFVDGGAGWIVGDQGLCLESQDQGRTWKARDLGTKATLRGVRFLDGTTGLLVGDGDPEAPAPQGHVVSGRPLRASSVFWTLDGGRTWKKGHLPTNFEVHCAEGAGGPVQFGTSGGEDHLDGDILRSVGELRAWDGRSLKLNRSFRALFDVRALDARRWIAVGAPVSVGFSPAPTEDLYTRSKCRALVSDDGGETWKPSEGSDGQGCLRGIASRKGDARILAVGDRGAVLASEDRGSTWKALLSGCENDLFAAARSASDPKVTVAVGDQETCLVTSDAGKTWRRVSWGESGAYLSVAQAGDAWIAVGENGLARRARMTSLVDANPVTPPAAAVKAPPATATPAQLERVRVGDTCLYQIDTDGTAKSRSRHEYRITAVTPTAYTIEAEVVEGTPAAGLPRKWTMEFPFRRFPDYGSWKVGEGREEKQQAGSMLTTRLADEPVTIGDRAWDCVVVEMRSSGAGGGSTVVARSWVAKSTEVPHTGVVKQELTQEVDSPQGRIKTTQSTTLVRFTRGKG